MTGNTPSVAIYERSIIYKIQKTIRRDPAQLPHLAADIADLVLDRFQVQCGIHPLHDLLYRNLNIPVCLRYYYLYHLSSDFLKK